MTPIETNPLRDAMLGWEDMKSALAAAEESAKQLSDMNKNLVAEVDFLRSDNKRLNQQKDYLQAYATGLTTRLDVIEDVIKTAKDEASKYAVSNPTAKAEFAADTAEQDSARAAVEGLPIAKGDGT